MVLLAGLILPAMNRVQARAHSLACLGNLHQWGVATHLFVADNDDLLPKDGAPNGTSVREGWYVDLPRLLDLAPYQEMAWRTNPSLAPDRCLWICPANRRRSNGENLFHYCLNQHVNRSGTGRQVTLSSIQNPATAVWLFDNGKLAAVAQQNNVHTNLHLGGAQFLFLDAHVTRFDAVAYWDFQENKGRTDHPDLDWYP